MNRVIFSYLYFGSELSSEHFCRLVSQSSTKSLNRFVRMVLPRLMVPVHVAVRLYVVLSVRKFSYSL
jgi:hypothetical protein